jgi:hypothetical protein
MYHDNGHIPKVGLKKDSGVGVGVGVERLLVQNTVLKKPLRSTRSTVSLGARDCFVHVEPRRLLNGDGLCRS